MKEIKKFFKGFFDVIIYCMMAPISLIMVVIIYIEYKQHLKRNVNVNDVMSSDYRLFMQANGKRYKKIHHSIGIPFWVIFTIIYIWARW